jgi:hypothetical protein
MKTHRLCQVLGLAILAVFWSLSSPAHAKSMVSDARELLEKASQSGDDATVNDSDLPKTLTSARGLLQHLPPANYHGHRQNAIDFINAALFQIKKNDPYHKVHDYIHKALEQLDYIRND